MANEYKFQVPWNPAEGVSSAILSAIQLANESHAARIRNQLAAQAQPSEIAPRQAQTEDIKAQEAQRQQALELQRQQFGILTGTTPGATPPESPAPSQPETPQPNPKDYSSGADFFRALVSWKQSQAQAPGPAPQRWLIGRTVGDLLKDEKPTPAQRQAITTAGHVATLKAYVDPAKALDGVLSTYSDALRERGEMERAIKTEVRPDS